jgi:hypothetical protein
MPSLPFKKPVPFLQGSQKENGRKWKMRNIPNKHFGPYTILNENDKKIKH